MEQVAGKYDLGNDEDRVAYSTEICELLATLASPVEREVYTLRAAEAAKISPDAMKLEVQRAFKRRSAKERKAKQRQDLNPAMTLQSKDRALRYDNIRSARAEEGILRLLCADPALFRGRNDLQQEDFSSPLLGRFYGEISALSARHTDFSVSQLADKFTSDEISHLTYILGKPEDLAHGARALDDYIEIVHRERSRLKADGTPKSADEILQELEKIRKRQGYGV